MFSLHKKVKLKFVLHFSHCATGFLGRCRVEEQVGAGERNWTVTAENGLGKVELSDAADLTRRGTSYPDVCLLRVRGFLRPS